MFCSYYIFQWIFYDLKNKNKYSNKKVKTSNEEQNIHYIESQITPDENQNTNLSKISNYLLHRLIEIWAYFETITLLMVLIARQHEFYDNFLHGFCSHTQNKHIVTFAIIYKIIASLTLIICCKTVSFYY